MKLLIHSQTLNSEAVKMAETWLALWLLRSLMISFSVVKNTVIQEVEVILKNIRRNYDIGGLYV